MAAKRRWTAAATALGACAMAALIVRAVLAGPPTTPTAKDIANADRVAMPPAAGAVDEHTTRVPGSLLGGNGVVEPAQREVKIAAHSAGVVAEVRVKEGDRVEPGAVLVVLENTAEKAAVTSAEADVALSQAQYDRALRGMRAEDVDAAIAEADAAKAKAELSKGILERTEALGKTGATTPDELDRTRRNAAADKASADASDARRRAAVDGSRAEDIAEARARLLESKAKLLEAEAQLEHLTVRAPGYGEILQVKLRVGEYYVPAGADPLLVMGDTRELRVRVDVDERDVGKLRLGAPAFVTADGFKGERFVGTVSEIGRRMGRKNVRTDDPIERIDTKILEVVIDLDDTSKLIPGQRVTGYVAP
jgi:HlyD family secretion protein